MKQRYLQAGWVFSSEAQGLARAYDIHLKTVTIFPTLVFSVNSSEGPWRLKRVGQAWVELVLSILP